MTVSELTISDEDAVNVEAMKDVFVSKWGWDLEKGVSVNTDGELIVIRCAVKEDMVDKAVEQCNQLRSKFPKPALGILDVQMSGVDEDGGGHNFVVVVSCVDVQRAVMYAGMLGKVV